MKIYFATLKKMGENAQAFNQENYNKLITHACQTIKPLNQLMQLGESHHHVVLYIKNLNNSTLPQEWRSEFYLHGRYLIDVRANVIVDYKNNQIKKIIGEPKFYLTEYTKVTPSPSGSTSMGPIGQSAHFTLKQWQKIYNDNLNFSHVGITLKKNKPLKNYIALC